MRVEDLVRSSHRTCCIEAGFHYPQIRVSVRPLCWGLGGSISCRSKVPYAASLQVGPVVVSVTVDLGKFLTRKECRTDKSITLQKKTP